MVVRHRLLEAIEESLPSRAIGKLEQLHVEHATRNDLEVRYECIRVIPDIVEDLRAGQLAPLNMK